MSSATAVAHPNIALVKYWGKRDVKLNLPATPSVSLTVAPFHTRTTVTWGVAHDSVVLNGVPLEGPPRHKVIRFLDQIDPERPPCSVDSTNDFPTAAGLASSSSGFAALALAATRAAGRERDAAGLSRLARLGSGSACRSIWGGFVAWPMGERPDGEDCHGAPLAPADSWDLAMVVALVAEGPKAVGSTTGMVRTQRTSPMFGAWVESASADYALAIRAVRDHDLEALGAVMERSTFKMHATMWTANPPLRYFQAPSIAVIERVEALRAVGTLAYVTLDAGPNVKVLCERKNAPAVTQALTEIGLRTAVLTPGGPARFVSP